MQAASERPRDGGRASWLERRDETFDDPGPYWCPVHGCEWWPDIDAECPVCVAERDDV